MVWRDSGDGGQLVILLTWQWWWWRSGNGDKLAVLVHGRGGDGKVVVVSAHQKRHESGDDSMVRRDSGAIGMAVVVEAS